MIACECDLFTLSKLSIQDLKTKLNKIVECLIDGRDCMAVLPTGCAVSSVIMFIP